RSVYAYRVEMADSCRADQYCVDRTYSFQCSGFGRVGQAHYRARGRSFEPDGRGQRVYDRDGSNRISNHWRGAIAYQLAVTRLPFENAAKEYSFGGCTEGQ